MKASERSCEQCGDAFEFSAGEQRFYAKREFPPPKRCPGCRDAHKKARQAAPGEAAWDAEEGFPATCSACGASTLLPFEPETGRPVYCGDCFRYR
ncbi:MAG TPA: zinc-binding protein [Planctomycetes bacterium]|nr:zinc-binding protein [Planctomycetota bacterium]